MGWPETFSHIVANIPIKITRAGAKRNQSFVLPAAQVTEINNFIPLQGYKDFQEKETRAASSAKAVTGA